MVLGDDDYEPDAEEAMQEDSADSDFDRDFDDDEAELLNNNEASYGDYEDEGGRIKHRECARAWDRLKGDFTHSDMLQRGRTSWNKLSGSKTMILMMGMDSTTYSTNIWILSLFWRAWGVRSRAVLIPNSPLKC
jgi:hypothetical protein